MEPARHSIFYNNSYQYLLILKLQVPDTTAFVKRSLKLPVKDPATNFPAPPYSVMVILIAPSILYSILDGMPFEIINVFVLIA